MKEFLGSKKGKLVTAIAGVLVIVLIICLLLFSCGKDSGNDEKVNNENGEGLIVIDPDEADEEEIDASEWEDTVEWEDIAGEDNKSGSADDKRDTDKDGTPDAKDKDDDNDGISDKKDDDDDNDGTPDKEDPDHPSNEDKEDDKDDENVQQDTSTSWGPFF